MTEIRKMRLIRLKYGITHRELGELCGMSPQRISEIELSDAKLEESTEAKLRSAFNAVAVKRGIGLSGLQATLLRHTDTIFDTVEETEYEL